MAQVGSANIRITADDSQATRAFARFGKMVETLERTLQKLTGAQRPLDDLGQSMQASGRYANEMERNVSKAYRTTSTSMKALGSQATSTATQVQGANQQISSSYNQTASDAQAMGRETSKSYRQSSQEARAMATQAQASQGVVQGAYSDTAQSMDNMADHARSAHGTTNREIAQTKRYMEGLSEEAQRMMLEMKQHQMQSRIGSVQFREDMIRNKYAYHQLADSSREYQGSTDDLLKDIEKLGKEDKRIKEQMMANNDHLKANFFKTVGTMLARSTQASKIGENFREAGGLMNTVNLPLLGIANKLETIAKKGQPAVLALKMLGKDANLAQVNKRMIEITQGVARFNSVALVATVSAGLFYHALHKGAKKASKEYATAWKEMVDSIKEMFKPLVEAFAEIMTPVYKGIKAIADMIIEFQKANPALTKFISSMIVLVPLLTALLSPLAVGFGLWTGIQAVMASLAPVMTPVITGFATILGTVALVATGLVAVGAGLVYLYKKSSEFRAFVNILKKGLVIAFEAIRSVIDKAIRKVKEIIKSITEWEGFIPVVLGLVTALGTYYSILGLIWTRQKLLTLATLAYNTLLKTIIATQKAYTVAVLLFNRAGGGMKGVLAVMRAGMLKLNLAMVANPIGLVIALIAGLVVGLVVAYKRSETFRKIVDKAFKGIKETAKVVFNWFTQELPKLAKRFYNWSNQVYKDTIGAFRNMRDRVVNFFKDLIGGANNLYNKTIKAIRSYRDAVVKGIKGAWNTAKDIAFKVTKAIVQFIVDAVKTYVYIFKNWRPLMKKGVTALYNIMRDGFKNAVKRIVDAFNSMVKYTKALPARLSKALKSTWKFIKQAFIDLAIAVYKTVDKYGTRIINFYKNLPARVARAFKSTWKFIRDTFTSLVRYLADKVYKWGRDMVAWFKKLPSRIASAFKSTWRYIKDTFTSLLKSIRDKVSSTFKTLVDWAKKLPSRIGSAFRSTVKSATSAISSFADSIKSKMSKTYNSIVDGAKKLPKKIGDGIRSLKDKAYSGVKSMGNSLLSGMGKAVNGLVGGINTILSKLEIKDRIPKWNVPKYAKGTEGHKGGLAILGDGGGRELFRTPDGTTALSPAKDTLYNLPKGTTVLSAEKTKKVMKNVPRYAKGVGDFFGESKDWVKAKYNGAKSKATDVKNFFKKQVKDIWEYASNPSKLVSLMVEKLGLKMPDGAGVGKIAKGGMNFLIKEAKNFIKSKFDMFGGGEGGVNVFKGLTKTQGFGKAGGANGYFHHDGVDYAGKIGSFIRSVTDGNVSFAGKTTSGYNGGFGNLVKVKNGIYEHFYAHLQKVLATNGQRVRAGSTLLGTLGSTGNSTGPHVHYEVRKNGTPVDPMPFLTGKKLGGNVNSWIAKAMSIAGVKGANWQTGLRTIAMGESGGNPNAVNDWDSNARAGIPSKGIMQVIPPTFSAYMKKGFGNIMNPIDNIIASINYIKDRYGSISNVPGVIARRLGKPYVGYETGGFINKQQVALLGEGNKQEVVIPLQNKRYMQPFADAVAEGLADNGGRGVQFNQTNVFNATGIMSPAESAKAVKRQSKLDAKRMG